MFIENENERGPMRAAVSAWYLSSWQWSMAALSCLVLAVFLLACALLIILIIAVVCWRKHKSR